MSSSCRLGAHVGKNSLVEDLVVTGAAVAQVFLSSNRSWTPPRISEEFRLAAAGVALYVHAPYLVNPASFDPVVRRRSRQALIEQTGAAAEVGALGVIVHGGHATGDGTVADGIDGWCEVLDGWESPVPLLVENTAGGGAAVARRFDDFRRLYDAIAGSGHRIGVCLDTCHAWAGGEPLERSVERLRDFAGRIDLVHVNDSRDPFDSGRDRHENLGAGMIPFEEILAVVATAGCDAVVETPNGLEAMRRDLESLRAGL